MNEILNAQDYVDDAGFFTDHHDECIMLVLMCLNYWGITAFSFVHDYLYAFIKNDPAWDETCMIEIAIDNFIRRMINDNLIKHVGEMDYEPYLSLGFSGAWFMYVHRQKYKTLFFKIHEIAIGWQSELQTLDMTKWYRQWFEYEFIQVGNWHV